MKNNRITTITLTAVLAAACLRGILVTIERDRLKSDVRRLEVSLAHAAIPLQPSVIRDTVTVVAQQVVEVESSRMKEALKADRQLIRDLRLRISQLEALQTTTVEICDTVPATTAVPDGSPSNQDSCFYYSDQWTDLRLSLRDSTFYYNIRDSLTTVVSRQYRHRFLFWRWGTKGYEVKIVNFNPHARIIYNRYIKVKRQ